LCCGVHGDFCYGVHDDFCYNAYGGSCGGVEGGAGEEAGKEVMAKQGDREKEYLCFALCAESMLEQKSKPMVFPRPGKTVIIVIAVLSVLAGLRAWQLYGYVFKANVQKNYVLYITEKTSFDMVVDSLETHHVMKNMKAFKWVARRKECRDYIKAGRYHFREGMSANQVVNILRSGLQEPVNLTFNNIRTPEQLAGGQPHPSGRLPLYHGAFRQGGDRGVWFYPGDFPGHVHSQHL